jgi:hypothetical protein
MVSLDEREAVSLLAQSLLEPFSIWNNIVRGSFHTLIESLGWILPLAAMVSMGSSLIPCNFVMDASYAGGISRWLSLSLLQASLKGLDG